MADYKVQLRQQHWITIEEFIYNADSEEDAIKQAQEFVDNEKDYKDGSYKLTAQEVPQPEEEAVDEPVQPEADQPE